LKFISWRGQGKTSNPEFAAAELWNLELLFCNRKLNFSDPADSDIDGFRYPVAGIIADPIDIGFDAISRIFWQNSPRSGVVTIVRRSGSI
jgi:hypothetical protein